MCFTGIRILIVNSKYFLSSKTLFFSSNVVLGIPMYEHELLSKAAKSCLENAKQYIKDARILYSTKSYGHTLALTVLSDIELGKSVMYHLCSKGRVTEDILPTQFVTYIQEKKYDSFASETWWVGLVLASNVEVLVPNIFTFCDYSGKISADGNRSGLSKGAKKQMFELIEKMKPENKRIFELLEFACNGFFVNFDLGQKKLRSPLDVDKSLVKERLEKVEERIENGEQFLLLSFSKIQQKNCSRTT